MATLDPKCWATLADFKEHLDIDSTDTSKDSFLINILNAAWKTAVNYIGQDLNSTTYTEEYDGDGTNSILLDQYPVISVTSVYDDITRTWAISPFTPDANTLIDASYYKTDLKTGKLTIFQGLNTFRSGVGNIRVIYVAGFATLPYDAVRAVILLGAWYAQRAGTEGRAAQTLGGKSEQYEMYSIPLYIRQMLLPYKKFAI